MPNKSEHFFHHAATVSFFTAFSRVMGLLRDMACAATFGGGMVWDAFSFAFRVPNLFRRLFGEGALSVASLPVLTEYLETRRRAEAIRVIRTLGTAMLLVLFACLLLGMTFFILLPFITDMTERWRLTFALSAVLLPYMIFVCLSALAGAVLHSRRHFLVPAASPVILNICWIVAVIVVAPLVSENMHEQIFVVAAGIIVAGIIQLAMHLYTLHRAGITYRPVIDLKHPALRRIFMAMAPIALGMAAFQVNALLDGVIAISFAAPEGRETFTFFGRVISYPMQPGANSALYFADRLMQFPLGIFGISIATAIFPVLSAHASKKDWNSFSRTFTDGLGAVIFIAIPAGVGLVLIGRPAIELLFERGAFTSRMTFRTYVVLIAHSAGLWAYCGRHLLERAFYACDDQLTPVKIAIVTIVLNLCLNLTLIWFFAEAGLALATATSAAVQFALLYIWIAEKNTSPAKGRLPATLVKTLIASAFMGGACFAVLHYLPQEVMGNPTAGAGLRVAGAALAGVSVYFLACKFLKTKELKIVCETFFNKKSS